MLDVLTPLDTRTIQEDILLIPEDLKKPHIREKKHIYDKKLRNTWCNFEDDDALPAELASTALKGIRKHDSVGNLTENDKDNRDKRVSWASIYIMDDHQIIEQKIRKNSSSEVSTVKAHDQMDGYEPEQTNSEPPEVISRRSSSRRSSIDELFLLCNPNIFKELGCEFCELSDLIISAKHEKDLMKRNSFRRVIQEYTKIESVFMRAKTKCLMKTEKVRDYCRNMLEKLSTDEELDSNSISVETSVLADTISRNRRSNEGIISRLDSVKEINEKLSELCLDYQTVEFNYRNFVRATPFLTRGSVMEGVTCYRLLMNEQDNVMLVVYLMFMIHALLAVVKIPWSYLLLLYTFFNWIRCLVLLYTCWKRGDKQTYWQLQGLASRAARIEALLSTHQSMLAELQGGLAELSDLCEYLTEEELQVTADDRATMREICLELLQLTDLILDS